MTAPQPPRRTPAGARLRVSRGRRWTRIEIDRWPIADADEGQADTARLLSRAAALYAVAHGKRSGVSYGSGRVLWSVTVPSEDHDQTLAALLALEAGDPAPAEALVARFAPIPSW
jgi:hypothetical protein